MELVGSMQPEGAPIFFDHFAFRTFGVWDSMVQYHRKPQAAYLSSRHLPGAHMLSCRHDALDERNHNILSLACQLVCPYIRWRAWASRRCLLRSKISGTQSTRTALFSRPKSFRYTYSSTYSGGSGPAYLLGGSHRPWHRCGRPDASRLPSQSHSLTNPLIS